MAGKQQQPAETQTTPKGLEIPVPKRKHVLDAFRKIVGSPVKKPLGKLWA